jgi:hypothetical protein
MIEIVVPVPEEVAGPRAERRIAGVAGPIGVLDNSKPRFGTLARALVAELTSLGVAHDSSLYARKPMAGRPAAYAELDRLSNGAVAVIVGSGD